MAKYQELLQKDKEMQEFLDHFEERKNLSQKRNQDAQEQIVELLGRIQQVSKHDIQNMPSQQEYQSLNQDVSYKEAEAKRAEMTVEQLLAERDQRLNDLEKVGQLENKLDAELKQLSNRIEVLKAELYKIDNLEEYKAQVEQQNQEKQSLRNVIKQKNDVLRSEIIALTAQHDAKRNQLLENETYTQLNAQEQKIKQLESVVFELKDCNVDSCRR
jgi:intraflagellar transport protein 74